MSESKAQFSLAQLWYKKLEYSKHNTSNILKLLTRWWKKAEPHQSDFNTCIRPDLSMTRWTQFVPTVRLHKWSPALHMELQAISPLVFVLQC